MPRKDHTIPLCIYFRFAFVLSMQLVYSKANFNCPSSSKSKSTLTRSIYGLSCGLNVVSSFIILCCKLRQRKTIRSGKRSSTISGIKERGLSTDTGRRKLSKTVRMIIMSWNMLAIVWWLMARNFNTDLWNNYLIVKKVVLNVIHDKISLCNDTNTIISLFSLLSTNWRCLSLLEYQIMVYNKMYIPISTRQVWELCT